MQKIKASPVLLIIGISLLLCSLLFNSLNTHHLGDLAIEAGNKISARLALSQQALEQIKISGPVTENTSFYDLYDREKIGIYYFSKDSLVYWNNAQIPIENNPSLFAGTEGLVKLRQGYYLYAKTQWWDKTAVTLCLVKPLYDLQNNYLKNNFSAWTGLPKEVEIDVNGPGKYPVLVGNRRLFSLKGNEEEYSTELAANIGFLVFVSGFLLILLALLLMMSKPVGKIRFFVLLMGVLFFRFLMLYFEWPSFFYKSILYDLSVFGNAESSLSFYMGDILLNAFTLLFIAFSLHIYLIRTNQRIKDLFSVMALCLVSVFIVNQFNHTLISLVTNSTLNFDFLSIFNIKVPAFVGIAILGIYSLALYLTVNKITSFFDKNVKGFFLFFGLTAACCVLQWLFFTFNNFENFWFLIFSSCMFLIASFSYSRFSLGLGLQILLMSVITSVLLDFYIGKTQKQNLERLSSDLSERRDAILESEFDGLPAKIASDKKLAVLLQFLPNGKKEIEQLLKQKYFSEYFNRYNVDFSLFDENCNPLLSPKDPVLMNEGFFDDRIRYGADSTFVPGLFFVKNHRNNSVYIGKMKINDRRLFVFLEPKQFEELGSFPDLLLDQSQQKQEVFKNFSYAIYRSGQNTNRYGTFNYPFFILDSATLAKSNPDFNHYYFQNEEYTQVISQKRKTFTDQFTYNSYVFLFFSIISYFCYFIYTLVFTGWLKNSSLTRRIQTIIIVLLLLVMSAVGITSGNLVSDQFETDNKQQLQEKTEIIISELATQFKPEEFFDESQKEIVNLKLNEYAHLFNTVISVFDKSGYLFNTSQPRLYDLGLAAPLANPKAFWNLRQNKSSAESVIESAGTLNYFSFYTPLYNSKQQLIGYVNLPYFAKRSDLVNELSGIISALINVYVILFVISILAGLILSGYITKPLRLIKQQISNISLGKQNEKIKWESNDEIGKLVSEYNQMLIKLEDSANLLAQSERESAWREMAKQVAHEIKNPLTPMKLNLQYLQHLMKNNPDDFREKFGKTSSGIIEQIDSLANIANEFSNFAKLPGAQLQTVNLVEIINSSVLVFGNQKNNLVRNLITETEILVKGDKDQCLRVFNNILKNAEQAVDGVENALIAIRSEASAEKMVISIRDNGCGIDDDLKPKIFSPNFTTKTTGSGLGLAMVKNIMQGFGGRIWFESEKNAGTVFYLEFVASQHEISEP
ncbi:MAG: HAMP domain-containing sensor histidine kinase [Bacteroidota bacterium]